MQFLLLRGIYIPCKDSFSSLHPLQAWQPDGFSPLYSSDSGIHSFIRPAVWRAFPFYLQSSQTASACISRSLTIRLWSAAHHRECHYDSAHSLKKKGHGRTPGRLPGCTYRLSRFLPYRRFARIQATAKSSSPQFIVAIR